MSIRVYVDGRICRPEDAVVPVFDRGFLYGDSVFETVATYGGRLLFMHEHLDRLERSAARVGMRLPERAAIVEAVESTMHAAANPDARVRIVVTRGGGNDGRMDLDPASVGAPRLVVIVQPLAGPTSQMLDEGVAVATVPFSRGQAGGPDPSVKSGNYLTSVLALGEARRRSGAHEAVFVTGDGRIAEGATSNVFLVKNGEVLTPSLDVGILAGITRAKVLDLARNHGGLSARERSLSLDDLRAADEVFLTSAARGVLPVTVVDGKPVGDGRPGPVTRRLLSLYQALARGEISV